MRLPVLSLALLLLIAAPASGAVVSAVDTSFCWGSCKYQSYEGGVGLRLEAGPGETNRLTVGALVRDTGAPLTAGKGCEQVDEWTARCRGGPADGSQMASYLDSVVDLGDGDDELTVNGDVGGRLGGQGGRALIDGGPGRDVIRAGVGSETIKGGPGADELHGGGGSDTFDAGAELGEPDVFDGGADQDTVSYRTATAPLRVDLATPGAAQGPAGENDTITGVESVTGGSGADVLLGSDTADQLDGGAGRDVISGGKGGDFLSGGLGRDRLDGGAGNDTLDALEGYGTYDGIAAQTGDVVLCGPGIDQSGYEVPADDVSPWDYWISSAADLLLDCEIHTLLGDESEDGVIVRFGISATRSGRLRLDNMCPRKPDKYFGRCAARFSVRSPDNRAIFAQGVMRDGPPVATAALSERAMRTLRARGRLRVTFVLKGRWNLAYTTDLRLSASR